MATPDLKTPWKDRVLATAFYLGAAPWWALRRRRRQNDFLNHHHAQSLAIFGMFLLVILALILAVAVLSYTMIHLRAFYDQTHPEPHLMSLVRKIFLCWLVFWLYGAGLALFGSDREMPLVAYLSRKKLFRRMAAITVVAAQCCVLLVTPFAAHASLLARQDAAPGKAYMVYEDTNRFPRWLFTLGFYRISLAAREHWGPGNAVVLRISKANIARALREGRFVFIGSHGMARGLLLEEGIVTPQDIEAMPRNPDLAFVYLTSCDSGVQRAQWEKAFAPAKVVTYDRLTAVLEHAWWLWEQGPEIVRAL